MLWGLYCTAPSDAVDKDKSLLGDLALKLDSHFVPRIFLVLLLYKVRYTQY